VRREDILGAWELVAFVGVDDAGHETYPQGRNARGLILYTADGYMSAQIMNPEGRGVTAYLTYTGPYRFDEETATLHHRADIALWHSWRGSTQVRTAELRDGDLFLSSPDGGTLHWRRPAH
jgi:lipocalin-like protein